MKVDFLIKNKVSEQDFESIVYDWLSDGDYTPDDIIENIITEHNLMGLPVHAYKCSYTGTASASLGYTREETYWVHNPNTKRQEMRTKIVIDWMPYSQNVHGAIDIVIYNGESRFNFLRPFIESTCWVKDDLEKINDNTGRDQKVVNKYQQNPVDAWNDLGVKEFYRKANIKIKSNLPSNLTSNFKTNLDYKINSQYSVIIPFWLFMYRYQGKPYYVAVDGNNPTRIEGVRPENKKRKYTVIVIRSLGWLSTVFFAWTGASEFYKKYRNPDYYDFDAIGVFIILFAVLGLIVERTVKNIKGKSRKRRQEKLTKMREAKKNS